ncbi:alanine racemase [Thauera linaloolentis]|uniref:Alanine racemase n=1 Tax=Thauera linaloolentis (strain DSM 12138 / JCM 21573 / CCUG 41526 / CIP 105981 / IAM 15112 / NBRC 102519 / 47Lol) TaxID=1123367 RepID=N6XZ83_THAL4|nr:alanine racemase [Thauera linaloolentis]ENO87146.1 alanine racemase [Thauera linaloolentis 47Lol = DSM 12138]MCM8566413.1 alanine racemase [Thauera linaloolentis]
MRPARALIDLAALRHNYRLARARHGASALAVIKANAYGHGAVRCARALAAEADGFAVAFLDEALELRAAGITQPILLLEGVFDAVELADAARHDVWLAVHHEAQLRMIETTPLAAPLHAWLKVNSGMNRAGFVGPAVATAWQRLQASGKVRETTLMTHFARADEPQAITTAEQIERFDAATRGLNGARSLANSAAILGWPQACRDWARPGILLYGADPMPGEANGLQAVMTLESAVMAVREIEPGQALGYGGRFVAERRTRVGLVAMGYADGYPRSVPDGTQVAVDGQPSRLIGRVSMDMLTVDLSDLPAAGIGSRIELWGRQVPVNDVAAAAGTIAYELLCNVKRVRLDYRE